MVLLERVHNGHGGHGSAPGMLGVGQRVTNRVIEENLEDAAGLLADEARDALHAAMACETADGGLGDALHVAAQYLAVVFCAALAEALSFLAATRRCGKSKEIDL